MWFPIPISRPSPLPFNLLSHPRTMSVCHFSPVWRGSSLRLGRSFISPSLFLTVIQDLAIIWVPSLLITLVSRSQAYAHYYSHALLQGGPLFRLPDLFYLFFPLPLQLKLSLFFRSSSSRHQSGSPVSVCLSGFVAAEIPIDSFPDHPAGPMIVSLAPQHS
ncbi:hypothetical protein LY76DRAFT_15135 [Colletotrichum caudatum]|nr:hypothetical protein LY76DRAFT_15135 [Colletotrichum caudatum]